MLNEFSNSQPPPVRRSSAAVQQVQGARYLATSLIGLCEGTSVEASEFGIGQEMA
jgi:hypothetical protein